jgi:Ser/Thr protein kinase RdoA (MazF antagonist)
VSDAWPPSSALAVLAAQHELAGRAEWAAVRREDLYELARVALAAYGQQDASMTLLEKKTNVTFRVDAPAGKANGGKSSGTCMDGAARYLLRICQPGAYSREEIQSELTWLLALRHQAELIVPEPVAADDESLVTVAASPALPEPRPCVVFRWVPGEMLEGAVTPAILEQVGELAARIHRCSERFVPPPGFSRPRWDCDRLLGAGAVIPAGQGEPLISGRAREILDQAARLVRADVAALGEGPEVFGLIHKDLEPDNTVLHEGRVYAIDFADCGWGHYLYDIAASLLPLREQAGFAALRAAFLAGYRRVRPLRPEHEALLETFFIARSMFAIRLMALKTFAERAEIRDYAHRVVPLMLGEIRRFVEHRAGGSAASTDADGTGRATTVRLLAHLWNLRVRLWAEGERLRFDAPKGALTAELRAELSERKTEILAFLRQDYLAARASAPVPTGVGQGDQGGRAPLSFAQQRLWFLDQLLPGSAEYNVARSVALTGEVRLPVLERSFNEVVRRHAVLRTRFESVAGEPQQVIVPALVLRLPEIDLRSLSAGARQRETSRLTAEAAQLPFELASGPLLRVVALRTGGEQWIVGSTLHHIVSDGWSLGLLFREMALLYEAFSRGLPSPLPELPLQYADFAIWQRHYLRGEVLEEQLAYWRRKLVGAAQAPSRHLPPSPLPPRAGARSTGRPAAPGGALGARRETAVVRTAGIDSGTAQPGTGEGCDSLHGARGRIQCPAPPPFGPE